MLAVRTVVYSNRRAIPDLLALVDKIHVASKVSLSLEFAVVAAVSTASPFESLLQSESDLRLNLMNLQVYVLLLVELIGWLRKDLLAAKK